MNKKSDGGSIKTDLISSFKATGLVPLDPLRVLQKIPSEDYVPEATINNVLVDYLMQQKFFTKRRRLEVEPGNCDRKEAQTLNRKYANRLQTMSPVTNLLKTLSKK
ncbi:hypothetical protein PPYR_14883 [Photinus pyralis]|uniref:Uncharacterized protein n=1 Tax=Photinus pyralis TaxID=7054 RepID=A0A5N4A017_PHOPY|nr:hypothetical protein PPYR_14883 [Photinus pyralis]